MKGVLLCGGRGTRLAPQTLIHNKHLLPVYTEHQGAIPMIWYPLHTLIKSGCTDILIVSSQEHCGDIIEFLGDGAQFKCKLTYKIQDHNDASRPVGIASAMKLIEGFVNNECFAVILGDNFYEDTFYEDFKNFEEKNKVATDFDFAHVFLKEVADPKRFGVASVSNGKITKIVEKPQQPESAFAVTGLYLFNHTVFDLLPNLKVSDRGELEISDINQHYVAKGNMTYTLIKKMWSDMGIPQSMIRTINYINETKYFIHL